MSWYLSEHNPVFWEEIRHRSSGRQHTGLFIVYAVLVMIPLLFICWSFTYWNYSIDKIEAMFDKYGIMSKILCPLVTSWPARMSARHTVFPDYDSLFMTVFLNPACAIFTLQHLLLALIAPGMAVSLLSGERDHGTLELLLRSKISGAKVIIQKFLALFTLLAVIPLLCVILFFCFSMLHISWQFSYHEGRNVILQGFFILLENAVNLFWNILNG